MKLKLTILCLMPLLLCSCFDKMLEPKKDMTNFYVLSSQKLEPISKSQNDILLKVYPVEISEYLDRKQIVTFDGQNKINLAEWDIWAEPLGKGFTRAVSENLVQLLDTSNINVFPIIEEKEHFKHRYELRIFISDIKASDNKPIELVGIYKIFDKSSKRLICSEVLYLESDKVFENKDFVFYVSTIDDFICKISKKVADKIINAKTK